MAKLRVNMELVGDSNVPVTRTESIKHGSEMLNNVINSAVTALNSKAEKSYVDTELNKKANASDVSGKADASTVSALSSRVSKNETDIAAANTRIDNIVQVPSGSTEGNAELIDIRTGADGKNYTTAGQAVRSQITDLKSDLSRYEALVIGDSYHLTGGNNVRINLSPTEGQICKVTNYGSASASFNLRDADNQDIRAVTLQPKQTMYVTVTANGTATVGGYCSAGYDVKLYILTDRSLETRMISVEELNPKVETLITDVSTLRNTSENLTNSVEIINDVISNIGKSSEAEAFDELRYENGFISGTDGTNSSYRANARIRSKSIEQYPCDITVIPIDGYKEYLIYYYNADNSFNSVTEWLKGETIIKANQKFRLVFTLNKDDTSDRTVSTILVNYSIKKTYPTGGSSEIPVSWQEGYIYIETGQDNPHHLTTAIRSNMFKVKAGTVIIPHVFGVPQIFMYEKDGTYLGTVTSLGLAHTNPNFNPVDSYMDRANSFEFEHDAYIRICYLFRFNGEDYHEYFGGVDEFGKTLSIVPPDFSLPADVRAEILRRRNDVLGKNQLNMTFATDIHEYAHHHKAHIYCANLTSKYLLDGGDLLSIYRMNFFENAQIQERHINEYLNCKVPVLLSKGNHDMMDGGLYTQAMWYELMQKPLRNSIMITNPQEPTGGYFYIDDEEYKTRIICLNTFNTAQGEHRMGQLQLKWICENALNLSSKSDEQNWKVFAFGHSHLIGRADVSGDEPVVSNEESLMSRVFGAVNSKSVITNSSGINTDYRNIKYAFVAYFCGHVHADVCNNDDGYLHVITTCDHPVRHIDGYVRDFGTKNEYAFDLMNFDFTAKLINCYRIGVGHDRFFHYETITNPTTLTATKLSGSLTWTSNTVSVATVNNGNVTKVSSGNAVITAKDNSGREEYFVIKFN